MLRWWSLLEKQSCSASKLHLKPRRFKTFVTALEHQLLKDRLKASKKNKPFRTVSSVENPAARKPIPCPQDGAKTMLTDNLPNSKLVTGKTKNHKKQETSEASKRRKSGSDYGFSAAARRRLEKAASAGVNLVAEAAEHVERQASQLGQGGVDVKETKASPQQTNDKYSSLIAMDCRTDDGKLRLQLFPGDESTRKSMEQDGHNPFLQLTLKPRKPISSVVRHLVQKWCGCSAAVGELRLFSYNAQSEKITNNMEWSLHDANINAGDVHSALGSPNLFRLRYAWISSRAVQSSQAECLSLSLREENILNDDCNLNVSPSSHILHCGQEVVTARNSTSQDGDGQTFMNSEPYIKQVMSQEKQLPHMSSLADFHQDTTIAPKNISMPSGNLLDVGNLIAIKRDINNSDQHSGGHFRNSQRDTLDFSDHKLPEISDHKLPESGDPLMSCSWLNDGSNDSFVQRIWAAEGSPAAATPPPPEIDWADGLSNISVGEFLNEVSHSARLASLQTSHSIQSLDSFDAAVAAQGGDLPGIESRFLNSTVASSWDGEETCDAFAFQRFLSHKRIQAPAQHNVEFRNSDESLRESDGVVASFVDFGSLEAWKQSFGHAELSFPEELKCSSFSHLSSQKLDALANGNSTQDCIWAQLQAVNSLKDKPSPSFSKSEAGHDSSNEKAKECKGS
ncbi:hypothetical protein KP509_11G041400 [Ceratopteris richardii]|nr:hypothetical protein KP509_11G041400 [Ceratopteris richardii]